MKRSIKILTSIPSVISLLLIFDTWTFDIMWKTFPNMKAYNFQMFTLLIIAIIALVYLIKRLWSYEFIDKDVKISWTLLMIFVFSQITTLYYIWKKDELLMKKNKINQLKSKTDYFS